jgi:hypothetical protein
MRKAFPTWLVTAQKTAGIGGGLNAVVGLLVL